MSKPVASRVCLDLQAICRARNVPPGVTRVYKLSSNETPLGASPKAVEAVKHQPSRALYAEDGRQWKLHKAIASEFMA